jgi:hypothetical protein
VLGSELGSELLNFGRCGQEILLESGGQVRSLRSVGGLGIGGLAGVASASASASASALA